MDKQECKNCVYLEAKNKKLRKKIVGWINWTYYLPKDWVPKSLLETSKQVLKGETNGMD